MNVSFFIVAGVCLLGTCTNTHVGSVQLGDRLIEYQLQGDRYAVVVVMDGITESQAKQMAKQRAAEITVMQGDKFFTIDSMYETEVIKSTDDLDQQNQRFYGNMYQELIIEGDFNRDRLRYEGIPNVSSYRAIRIEFTTYKNRPSYKAIDACSLTPCGSNGDF